MIKLGQMVLKGVNRAHNDKIGPNGFKEVNRVHNNKIGSNSLERNHLVM